MLSDEELLARIAAREAEAFEQLAARYRDGLRQYLMGMTRNATIAEDLLQETLLRVWTQAGQWEERGSVRAWMFRTATNLALNDLRNRKRRREQPLEPDATENTGDAVSAPLRLHDTAAPTPEQCALQTAEAERLRRLIGELPAPKRDVLRLVCEEDMELRDVAQLLDIPEGTVKSRLHHARNYLRRCWNAEQGGEE